MINFWMILSVLVIHPKLDDAYDPLLDDLYDPLLDDSEHAHYPKLDDLYGPLLNDYASSNNTIFNNVQQLQCDLVASISTCYHLGWRLGLGELQNSLLTLLSSREHGQKVWT